MQFPQQIPENWPELTVEGVLIAIIVFVIVTYVAYEITHSRWAWLPCIVFGVIAEIAVSAAIT